MVTFRMTIIPYLLCVFFFSACTAHRVTNPHEIDSIPSDFLQFTNQGPEYTILENLLIDAIEVQHTGQDSLHYGDNAIPVDVFNIRANVTIQTACHVVRAEFAEAIGVFNLYIGRDETGCVHDQMLDEAYDYWISEDEDYRRDHRMLPAQKHLFFVDGQYVLYDDGDLLDVRVEFSPFYWVNDKVMQIQLVEVISDQEGFGPTLTANILFQVDGVHIRPFYKSYFSPDLFIEMYEEGVFERKCSDA